MAGRTASPQTPSVSPEGSRPSVSTVNEMTLTPLQGGTLLSIVITYPSAEVRDIVLGTGMTDGMERSYARLEDEVGDLLFALIVGVILGGRLGYILFYDFASFAANPARIIRIWEGGLAFHGGALGAILAAILPRTEAETRALRPVGNKLAGTAKAAAEAAKEAGTSRLAELGLTREKGAETLRLVKVMVHDGDKVLLLHRRPERFGPERLGQDAAAVAHRPHPLRGRRADNHGHRCQASALRSPPSPLPGDQVVSTRLVRRRDDQRLDDAAHQLLA